MTSPETRIDSTFSEQQTVQVPTGHTRKQSLLLFTLAIGNCFVALCGSLQAPFFPKEAEKKGSSPTGYGLVLGVFHLTIVIMSPIFGGMMSTVRPKFMLNMGMFVVAVCCILFGFLDRAPHGTTFLVLALLVRIMEGVGSAAYRTSCFAIVAAEFDNVASHFGTLETMFGIGLIVGPTMGGAIYQLSGYSLPFLTCGVALILCAVATSLLLPDTERTSTGSASLKKFIAQPIVIVNILMLIAPALCVGFNQATLEPHLRQFDLPPSLVGLVFVLNAACYAGSAPVWGILCDKKHDPNFLGGLGSILTLLCFLTIGPAPFFPSDTKLWMVLVALVLFGGGMGAIRVTGFISTLTECRNNGFPDDLATFGLVSGTMTAALSLGLFFGPILGGYMLETIGYRNGTLVMSSLVLSAVVIMSITVSLKRARRRRLGEILSERTPLLPTTTTIASESCKGCTSVAA